MKPLKIIHFVTGGFTGSTAIAIELSKATAHNPAFESLLVLRKKKSTDPDRVQTLVDAGINLRLIAGWSHLATIMALVNICRTFKPDILVCHGFSEHLWGRYAGLIAGVAHLIHVEHNSRERYSFLRLAQARWLAKYTDKIIGCSEGVRQALLKLKFPSEKTLAINNGINLTPYQNSHAISFSNRLSGIVMAARFAKQKDHLTLIQAIAVLRTKGLTPNVYLAGLGSQKHMNTAKKLVAELQLEQQIHFLGFCATVPTLLMENKICVLSTHYEGMPLSLCEGMAAGCAVVASKVVGVQEMINDGVDGLLVTPNSPEALASALATLLTDNDLAERLAFRAQQRAVQDFSLEKMAKNYETVFLSLCANQQKK